MGHEIDFTIADFVADVRAPTPSGAAELVVPDCRDWLRTVTGIARRIARTGQRALEDRFQTLDWLSRRLAASSPEATLQRQHNHLRELRGRLSASMRHDVLSRNGQLQTLDSRLLQQSPALAVQRTIGRNRELRQRLSVAAHELLGRVEHRVALAGRALDSVSPLATLGRGYAIVQDASGKVLRDATQTAPGEQIEARLAKGCLVGIVKEVKDAD